MKYECIGVSFKKGQFTNEETGQVFDYNNVVFHCVHDTLDNYGYGMECTDYKIKRSLLDYDDNEIKQFIGRNVKFDFLPKGQRYEVIGVNLDN